MKIKYFYLLLPPDEQERALYNADAQGTIEDEANSLLDAIDLGMTWSSTPEGKRYWEIVYCREYEGKLNQPLSLSF